MAWLDPGTIRLHRVGAGPPVVLLHGVGETRHSWETIASLGGRFTLLSYDFPDHGETPSPGVAYEIDDLSEQLAAVLTAGGIADAHLVGNSLGGMVAQCFAASWPERVGRLVLCDTTPALNEGLRDEYLASRNEPQRAMARADLMDLAEEIFAPALVLCAEGADLAVREGSHFLARSMPRGQFALVPGAALSAVGERPDWIVRVLLDFLG